MAAEPPMRARAAAQIAHEPASPPGQLGEADAWDLDDAEASTVDPDEELLQEGPPDDPGAMDQPPDEESQTPAAEVKLIR